MCVIKKEVGFLLAAQPQEVGSLPLKKEPLGHPESEREGKSWETRRGGAKGPG